MKQTNAFKLTFLAASVAALGVGCASSGYARYDADTPEQNQAMGASASVDVGTSDTDLSTQHYRGTHDHDMNMASQEGTGQARVTVSSLSFTPDTRATWVNRFPFWDHRWQTRTIDIYTFAAPDPSLDLGTSSDLPQFSMNLPPGSVFVESAGGAGETRAGRVIQHSPVPIR